MQVLMPTNTSPHPAEMLVRQAFNANYELQLQRLRSPRLQDKLLNTAPTQHAEACQSSLI
jgi:hypothetical protein